MSQEGLNSANTDPLNNTNIAQALMEEDLEREIARNQAANRMAKEREEQALAARQRAQESQRLMQDMMQKYEVMKAKLEFTKKHLDDTNTKIGVQERLTEKIEKIKERVEQYTDKRESVGLLNSAVMIKADVVEDMQLGQSLDAPNADAGESSRTENVLEQNSGLLNRLKEHVEENEARLKKREELKVWLEEQVNKGEKRAAEQTRIAKAKEDLLELKLRELKLQSQRLERRKEQQARAETDNQEFLSLIDKELEEMEDRTRHKDEKERELAQLTLQREKLEQARNVKMEIAAAKEKTRQLQLKLAEKRQQQRQQQNIQQEPLQPENEKKTESDCIESEEKQEAPETLSSSTEEHATDPSLATATPIQDHEPTEADSATSLSEEVEEVFSSTPHKSPCPSPPGDVMQNTEQSKEQEKEITIVSVDQEIEDDVKPLSDDRLQQEPLQQQIDDEDPTQQPQHDQIHQLEEIDKDEHEKIKEIPDEASATSAPNTAAIDEEDNNEAGPSDEGCAKASSSTDPAAEAGQTGEHSDLSDTVKKIEGKCASVKGDLAEMAMSEQYLRTKQAMLLAKKKEKEMDVAEKIAKLREAEVMKMKEKVAHMQDLLSQRKEKLKIQEEMMKEKVAQKVKIDKEIESKKRRGNYCEKELIDRVIFEKEPPKKK